MISSTITIAIKMLAKKIRIKKKKGVFLMILACLRWVKLLMVLEKRTNQFLGGQTQKDFSDAMAKDLDDHVKTTLNERYQVVLQALRDNKDAIEQMTSELLEIEVITGERVREIIKEHGGIVFEGEDLHSDSLDKSDVKEDIKSDKTQIENKAQKS